MWKEVISVVVNLLVQSHSIGVESLRHISYLLEDEKRDQAIADKPPSIAQSQEEEDDRGFDDAKYRIVQHLLCHVELGGEDLVVHGPHMVGNIPHMESEPLILNPVVDNPSIRHCEYARDHTKSVVCWGSISK